MFAIDPQLAIPFNKVHFLVDGEQTFEAMLQALHGAQQSIVFESYIFANDHIGQRFRDVLITKAANGVRIYLLIDGIGSWLTPDDFFAPLQQAGGHFIVYNPPAPWRPRWGFWRRNHRKILVVDSRYAFIGGINISDDYAPTGWNGNNWHDSHLRIEGPAAAKLAEITLHTWNQLASTQAEKAVEAPAVGATAIQILESRRGNRTPIRESYLKAIRRAQKRICIGNAYCIPDRKIRGALIRAARRGVQVQLLLAGQTDVHAVRFAGRALYQRFLNHGIEIYEWHEQVFHAKTAVIDGLWCSIGSYNMDRRSLLHNLEANVACVDGTLGQTMQQAFDNDLQRAVRINQRDWHRRSVFHKLVEKFFYALRYFL